MGKKNKWPLSEKSMSVFEKHIKEAMSNKQYLSEYLCQPCKLVPNVVDGVLIIDAKSIRSIINMLHYTKNAPDITAVVVNYTGVQFGGSVEDASELRTAADLYHAPIVFNIMLWPAWPYPGIIIFLPQFGPMVGQVIRFNDDI